MSQYSRNEYPIYVGRLWTPKEIVTAAKRGPHKLALVPEAIDTMKKEVIAEYLASIAGDEATDVESSDTSAPAMPCTQSWKKTAAKIVCYCP